MRFLLVVTGPAYGTQQASSALQFAHSVLASGYELISVFFHREGVYNSNKFSVPSSDEYDLIRAWHALHEKHQIELHVCIASALRRGIVDTTEARHLKLPASNIQPGFSLSGLGVLAEHLLICDRMVQF